VTWHYLRTLFWLRARLSSNQLRKSGTFGQIIQAVVVVLKAVGGFLTLIVGVVVGRGPLGEASPLAVMLVWDGVAGAFLFFWMIGLVTELQRSEIISVERFLGLPVPARSVFIVNYIGSFFGLSTALFVPGMIGLAIGLSVSRGPQMLGLLPLVAGFVLLVTAITYQFQGWLAKLMADKRRRRSVVAVMGLLMMLVVLVPSQMSWVVNRIGEGSREQTAVSELLAERRALRQARAAGTLGDAELSVQLRDLETRLRVARSERQQETLRRVEAVALPANLVLPLGWLPYGARALAEGRVAPAALGLMGLVALGSLSLARSYRTTLRLYLGTDAGSMPVAQARPTRRATRPAGRSRLVERRLPGLSEHVTAIALASFQSLLRAPEARLMLLTTLLMGGFFAGFLLRPESVSSPYLRPLLSTAGFVMVLVGLSQLTTNLFGFDRDGFRVFVLGPVARRDVLLGKNLALLPMALAIGLPVLVLIQVLTPMRADHFVATLVQMSSLYLVFCLVGNTVSVMAPTPIKPGSLQPVRPKGIVWLFHLGSFFALPMVLGPLLLPVGVEALLAWLGYDRIPAYLILACLEVVVVAFLYRWILGLQGRLLQAREQRILEIVTSVTD
jgi:hypothetical protein